MGDMNAAIKKLIGTDADKAAARERLEMLRTLMEARLGAEKSRIEQKFLNPDATAHLEIPGIRAIRSHQRYHVATSEGLSDKFRAHLDRAMGAFFSLGDDDGESNKSKVKKGVGEIIGMCLDGLIGNTSAGESEERFYIVMPENNAFIRVDIYVWRYNLTSSKFIESTDTGVGYLLYKSVIDHKQLRIDEMIYLVTEALNSVVMQDVLDESSIIDESDKSSKSKAEPKKTKIPVRKPADLPVVKEYIQALREIYSELEDNMGLRGVRA